MTWTSFFGFFVVVSLLIMNYNIVFGQDENMEDSLLRDLIYSYSKIGHSYIDENLNLDTAEYYLSKALDLQYITPGYTINDRVARNHINIATLYRKISNNILALDHLNSAEQILLETDPESPLLAYIYNNKGNIIKSTYDIYRTRDYYEYALNWLKITGYENSEDFLKVSLNYINILFQLQENELAFEYLEALDIDGLSLSPDLEFDFHLKKGASFTILGLTSEALHNYQQAKILLDKDVLTQKVYSHFEYYYEIVLFYIKIEDFKSAYKEIAKSMLFLESIDQYSNKLKTIYNSSLQRWYAYILNEEGQYDKAIKVIDEITEDLKEFFEEQSLLELNSKITNENASLLPELSTLRSRTLYNIYKLDKSEETLLKAFNAYKQTISILNTTRLSIQSEDSKFFATSQIILVYNEAIMVGKLLYEMTGNLLYLEKAFEFAESSKSFALFSEIKDVEAIEFSDIPADVKDNEKRLIGRIKAYEKALYEEQLSLEPNNSEIEFYETELFHLRDDYRNLIQEIEQNYEQYFEMKYNPKFVSLEGIRNSLPHNNALIEYVLTDSMLITFVIDNQGINAFSQNIELGFPSECLEYYTLINAQNFSKDVHDTYKRFVILGRKFYKILVEPCLEFTDKKNLTIVPDGAITYLPFGTLLSANADMEYINYMNLPYLVHEYSIGYSHSATLMFSERLKSKTTDKKVLAFAPKYTPIGSTSDTAFFRQVINEDEFLLPLRGIISEVQSIKETVPSRVFLNEKATEANFKKYASDYNVLHLAMHTIMKDQDPLYSLLAFTNAEVSDTIEDNKLYAYEIYNMKLNAQMAVLSSCSSGFGKMHKGEGMMSLARGFMYAGCPSIVMTLWQVADQSSSELMRSFYKYLKKGKSKQEAMRLAKIKYLETADDITSNPYFWSGFVVVGDSSPIYKKSGIVYWVLLISLFVGVLVIFQYRRS